MGLAPPRVNPLLNTALPSLAMARPLKKRPNWKSTAGVVTPVVSAVASICWAATSLRAINCLPSRLKARSRKLVTETDAGVADHAEPVNGYLNISPDDPGVG